MEIFSGGDHMQRAKDSSILNAALCKGYDMVCEGAVDGTGDLTPGVANHRACHGSRTDEKSHRKESWTQPCKSYILYLILWVACSWRHGVEMVSKLTTLSPDIALDS
ncbi:hypothetical protein EJ110_NYTH15102 [Nymphaea thermarum]|nr:hypothetical protein EJ110_NYTH15102 [Nymphaea thermarum]